MNDSLKEDQVSAVLFGRANSKGLPGKNTMDFRGRQLMEFPLIALDGSERVGARYVSTDSESIAEIGARYGCEWICRPEHLSTDSALLEDAIVHAREYVLQKSPKTEILIILLCNAPNLSARLIDQAIAQLESRQDLDSVISVGEYPMFAPERARRANSDGFLDPYVDFQYLTEELTCARQSHDKCFFADGGITAVRMSALEDISSNLLPFRWMGKKIGYVEQGPGGFDVDYEWQLASLNYWLEKESIV